MKRYTSGTWVRGLRAILHTSVWLPVSGPRLQRAQTFEGRSGAEYSAPPSGPEQGAPEMWAWRGTCTAEGRPHLCWTPGAFLVTASFSSPAGNKGRDAQIQEAVPS